MTSIVKQLRESWATKKANEPQFVEIVTSEFVDKGTVKGVSKRKRNVSVKAHFSAVSKTVVGPKKGMSKVLWNISEVAVYDGEEIVQPFKHDVPFKEMLSYMLMVEAKAAQQAGKSLNEFMVERRKAAPKSNIANYV